MSDRPRRERAAVSYREYGEHEVYRQVEDDRHAVERRRSGRVTTKECALDRLACARQEVPGASDLNYAVGGAEVGGSEADRILNEVEIDETAIGLRAQFAACRRVVLFSRTRPVAAAVVEMHAAQSVFEVPILAVSRHARQQGHGSVLLALLLELASSHLSAAILVVSATEDSRRFWLAQGLHDLPHCDAPVAAAMRALSQRGARYGFFETTLMAMAFPEPPGTPGELVARARARLSERAPAQRQGVAAARAAEMLGYEELGERGPSFALGADGARTVVTHYSDPRPVHVPYARLLAHPSAREAPASTRWCVRRRRRRGTCTAASRRRACRRCCSSRRSPPRSATPARRGTRRRTRTSTRTRCRARVAAWPAAARSGLW